MATQALPGGRNDLYALKEARRLHDEAAGRAKKAMEELEHMREGAGRPDYGRMSTLLGKLSLDLSAMSKHLEEMWVLRAVSGQFDPQIGDRVAFVESQVAMLTRQLEEMRA